MGCGVSVSEKEKENVRNVEETVIIHEARNVELVNVGTVIKDCLSTNLLL
jgi:hypothetical protein